jgi:hypothetical protein
MNCYAGGFIRVKLLAGPTLCGRLGRLHGMVGVIYLGQQRERARSCYLGDNFNLAEALGAEITIENVPHFATTWQVFEMSLSE